MFLFSVLQYLTFRSLATQWNLKSQHRDWTLWKYKGWTKYQANSSWNDHERELNVLRSTQIHWERMERKGNWDIYLFVHFIHDHFQTISLKSRERFYLFITLKNKQTTTKKKQIRKATLIGKIGNNIFTWDCKVFLKFIANLRLWRGEPKGKPVTLCPSWSIKFTKNSIVLSNAK